MVMAGSEIYRLHAVGSENGATVTHLSGKNAKHGVASGAGRGEWVMNISKKPAKFCVITGP